MQVGAVLVLEAGPLELRNGGVDIEQIRAYTAERLARTPRARQRGLNLALGQLPVWVDDPFFDLVYHVRHVALPRPGDERQLKRLAARIFSEALDPEKPPWELWVVEGLDEGRFALIAKADAALVSGVEGFDPLEAILDTSGEVALRPAPAIEPRPTPSRVALMRDELARRAREIARPESVGAALGQGLRSALNALERALASRSELPLTGPAGSQRRIELLELDQADLRMLAESLGASRQAILLAALAGALRVYASRRGLDPAAAEVRVLTPIGVGGGDAAAVAPLVALPLSEPDPRLRLEALRGAPVPPDASGASLSLLRDLARLHAASAAGRPASLCVTALLGSEAPVFVLGSPVRGCTGIAPLLSGHTLGITATFYAGRVRLGFSGDAALAPDLPLLADSVAASFDELRRLSSPPVHRAGRRADPSQVREMGADA
jgi:WS/DGAT/MGAT family acyltransferase